MKIISDIFGVLGVLITVVLYQQKTRKSLLIFKLTNDLVWLVHYAFIGAYSGAAVCVIAAVRELVFVKSDPKNKKAKIWLPIFIIVAIISTVLTWNNAFSTLTCLASCLAVTSFFIGNPSLTRILVFPISACMLTYDIACSSFAGIINECFAISSSLIGVLFIDRKKKSLSDTQ